jgi:pilus assembly protein CpaB
MDRKKLILLVAALVIAALTAFMARTMFSGGDPAPVAAAKPPEPTGPQVLVATRALPVGTIITADAFRYQPWPKELVEEAYFIKPDGSAPPKPVAAPTDAAAAGAAAATAAPVPGPEGAAASTPEELMQQLVGTVVRNPITAGQPLTKGALVFPGDRGFLAAALGPGMRAVTVPVSALTGVAGFVFPGDRVDMVLTQNVNGQGTGDALRVSETIIRNLRVLATDQRAQSAKDDKGNTIVSAYKLVTLEVTPQLAEKIAVAQTIGTLSLSLRALADNAAELEQALASGSVSLPKGASPEEEARILAQLNKQPTSGASTYTTGGQVSRFQRRTAPAVTPVQIATEQVRLNKRIEEASKQERGPIVRVYRADQAPQEIEVNKLKQR